eukprot:832474-Rhodomonas_salina.1
MRRGKARRGREGGRGDTDEELRENGDSKVWQEWEGRVAGLWEEEQEEGGCSTHRPRRSPNGSFWKTKRREEGDEEGTGGRGRIRNSKGEGHNDTNKHRASRRRPKKNLSKKGRRMVKKNPPSRKRSRSKTKA